MDKCTLVIPYQAGCLWLARKKSKYGAGLYNGWGGKKTPQDPSMLHAAVREFEEESGVIPNPLNLELVAILRFYEETKVVFECYTYFLHESGEGISESDEMGAPEVFSPDQVPYHQMMPADEKWLPIVIGGERIAAQCWYSKDQKELLNFSYGPIFSYINRKAPPL